MLRFVQEDKIGYGSGANLYAYVGGAVLDARDPDGSLPVYEKYMWCYECMQSDGSWADNFMWIGSILPTIVTFALTDGRVTGIDPRPIEIVLREYPAARRGPDGTYVLPPLDPGDVIYLWTEFFKRGRLDFANWKQLDGPVWTIMPRGGRGGRRIYESRGTPELYLTRDAGQRFFPSNPDVPTPGFVTYSGQMVLQGWLYSITANASTRKDWATLTIVEILGGGYEHHP